MLRCIAGLESQCSGFFQLHDEVWQNSDNGVFVPTFQRALGYVFQEPRLFPHLTVEKNLLYGYKRTPAEKRNVDLHQVIELLGVEHLLQRKPEKLSGGEQQRVSIGRALLASPKLLLMDEPLAALDMARKQEILPFIKKLRDELSIPIIYVSHSMQEIIQIADTLVFIRQGKVIAAQSFIEFCSDLQYSHLIGDMAGSVVDTEVESHDKSFGLTRLSFPGGYLYVPLLDAPKGAAQRTHILARNVGIALNKPQETTSVINILPAKVVEVAVSEINSHSVQVKLDVGVPILASISRMSLHKLRLEPGQSCYALVKAVSLGEREVGLT